MYSDVIELIRKYENRGDFTYAYVGDNTLTSAEEELGVKLPIEYVWFLKSFGHGGLDGIETLGVANDERLIFKDETIKYRAFGLPINYIVIENCDEWIYCLDSTFGKVVMWSLNAKEVDEAYNSFIDYLEDRVMDAIENM